MEKGLDEDFHRVRTSTSVPSQTLIGTPDYLPVRLAQPVPDHKKLKVSIGIIMGIYSQVLDEVNY